MPSDKGKSVGNSRNRVTVFEGDLVVTKPIRIRRPNAPDPRSWKVGPMKDYVNYQDVEDQDGRMNISAAEEFVQTLTIRVQEAKTTPVKVVPVSQRDSPEDTYVQEQKTPRDSRTDYLSSSSLSLSQQWTAISISPFRWTPHQQSIRESDHPLELSGWSPDDAEQTESNSKGKGKAQATEPPFSTYPEATFDDMHLTVEELEEKELQLALELSRHEDMVEAGLMSPHQAGAARRILQERLEVVSSRDTRCSRV